MAVCCCEIGQMRLAVGFVFDHPRRAVGMPVRGLAAFFVLFVVEVRLGTALPDKSSLPASYSAAALLPHTDASAPAQFPGGPDSRAADFRQGRSAVDMIGQATKRRLAADACRWPERRRRPLQSGARRNKLVALRQVAPAFLRGFCRKVRIEIAIVTLRGGHQFNHSSAVFSSAGSGFWHSDQATASSHFATSLS
ncbi:Uncharacterised protein [Salmonella enterica subsp. enterica]|nr:Uncharacterised protein [Salmonella enterica subsp. enterica]